MTALSDERRALLDLLAARRPTTAGQLRFWRLNQSDPADPAYSWPWAVRVDSSRLPAALDTVLDRHDVLTSAFRWEDDELRQVPCGRPEPRVVDGGVQQELRRENEKPFHLTDEPPLRVSLLPDDVLLVNIHNIANDGWSMRVFLDDLSRACRGEPLDAPTAQYHEHAARQRKWLATAQASRQIAYWQRRLAGLTPRSGCSSEAAVERATISPRVADTVRELGRRERATPFMALFALFARLHADRTGSPDVAIGTSVSGRDTPDVRRTVGYFVNRLVLRMNTGGSTAELIARARTTALEAFANSKVPFEHLVSRLFPDEYGTAAPLVDVMFVMDAGSGPLIEPEYRTTKFALVVNVRPDGDGFVVEAHHRKGAECGVLDDYTRLLKGLTT